MKCPDCSYVASDQSDLEDHQVFMARHDLHKEN